MTALVHFGGVHRVPGTTDSYHERDAVEREEFQQCTKKILIACIELANRGEVTVELSPHQRQIVDVVEAMVRSRREFFHSTVSDLQLNATNTASKLLEVWEAIFVDGINSGRVLTMLCFCQYVTVYADREGLPSIRESVPHWAAAFITRRLRDWITSHGGWVSSIYIYIYIYRSVDLP